MALVGEPEARPEFRRSMVVFFRKRIDRGLRGIMLSRTDGHAGYFVGRK
jgi:hypothetical protein